MALPWAEPTLSELRRLDRAQLDEVYRRDRPIDLPSGLFVGEHLAWIEPPHEPRLWRVIIQLGLCTLPFGVDFGRRRWFFVAPRLLVGRFDITVGRSRWRDTDTVRLHYGRSRLPAAVRARLYDEVKPLGDGLCLGIAGIDAPVGTGDICYFALSRRG